MTYSLSLEQDAKIRELYDEIEDREKKEEKSVLKNLPKNTRVMLIGAIAFIIWTTYSGTFDKITGAILVLIVGAIVYFSGYSSNINLPPLTENECRAKLHQQLREKQLYPMGHYHQISPHLKIKHQPVGNLRFYDSKPWKWVLGIALYNPDTKMNHYYAAICNPYSGNLQGLIALPGGLQELDFKDITVIPHRAMWIEKQYQKYMGKWPDKK